MIFVFQGLVQGRRAKSVAAPYTYFMCTWIATDHTVHGSLRGLGLRLSQDPA